VVTINTSIREVVFISKMLLTVKTFRVDMHIMQILKKSHKYHIYSDSICLQCFEAVGWVAGRASGLLKTEWWDAGMVIWLGRGADLHMA